MSRVVQPAPRDGAPLVRCYLIGPHLDDELRAALPDCEIWATDRSAVTPEPLPPGRRVALVGYSAGCQPVRAALLRGDRPDAVLCIDGAHASMPPQEWQIDTWRRYAARAKRGEALFVYTATQQTYTERLPPSRRFLSTRTVMDRVMGHECPPGTEIHEIGLHVYSVESERVDKAAHLAQQSVWLPRLARELLAPWLGRIAMPEPQEAPTEAPREALEPEPVATGGAARLLEWYQGELRNEVREEPVGSNSGPRVREYLAGCVRNKRRLRLTSGAWCAAMAGFGLRWALGDDAPPWRASGAEMVQDALAAGTWIPVRDVRLGAAEVLPGWIAILDRPTGEGWTRHVCCVESCEPGASGRLVTIGGNEGDRVKRTVRAVNDADLLGFVRVT